MHISSFLGPEDVYHVWENSSIGLAIVGTNGKWEYVNPAVCAIVEYTEMELLERTFQDITHPEDLLSDLRLLQECITGTRDEYSMAKRYITKTGKVRWVSLHVNAVRMKDGQVGHFVSQIVPLERNGTVKVTSERPGAVEIKVDNSRALGKFLIDNWKTIIPTIFVVFSAAAGFTIKWQQIAAQNAEILKKFESMEKSISELKKKD